MKNYLLVTTALEETWKKNKKIFFLGEWCKLLHRKPFWGKLVFDTQPYHWDDRNKLNLDYLYSKKLYSQLVDEIGKNLNYYHKISHGNRYWKIILGPWLLSFIQSILERYENIKHLKNDERKFETIILKIQKDIILPRNFESYSRLIISDTWNHFIFGEIIKNCEIKEKIYIEEKEFEDRENFRDYLKEKNYSKIREIYSFFTNFFKTKIKNEKFLISESYLGFFNEVKLNLKLRCLPKFNNFDLPSENYVNWVDRENFILKNFNPNNEFERILKKLIKIQIPISYFENYKKIRDFANKINWPTKPEIIFTSHFLQKTTQTYYTAEKIEKFNSKLIVGQHGGVYGQHLFSTTQDHEIDVCDKFLTWGWKDEKKEKIIPFGIIKNIPKIKYKKKTIKFY